MIAADAWATSGIPPTPTGRSVTHLYHPSGSCPCDSREISGRIPCGIRPAGCTPAPRVCVKNRIRAPRWLAQFA